MAEEEPKRPAPDEGGDENGNSNRNQWVQIARYSQLGFALPAATLVGWLIGGAIDRWLHTRWLYLVGLIVGILAGFAELIRTVTWDDKE